MIYFTEAIYQLHPNVVSTIDNVAYDADGNIVTYDTNAVQDIADKIACKYQAKELIALTDWAALPDVNLTNKSDFTTYRAQLRELIINPVANPTWPVEPQPVWSVK